MATANSIDSALLNETGTGSFVGSNNATMVAPALGTPASATLTNCTGLPVSTGVSGFGAGIATFLTTPTSLNLKSAVTDETGSGALVFATDPLFVTPKLGTPTSGTLTNCTDLPITTGVSGLASGMANFLELGTSAKLQLAVTDPTGTGFLVFSISPTLTTPLLGTPTSGTLTNCTGLPISTGVSGLGSGIATFLATPSSANLLSAVTDETGTGLLVFATSPTLTTPVIGTPTSGTLTNCTGLPISTGVAGLAAGIATFLATPTSANLAAAVTNETGTGLLVFATSPTLTTPVLGTPSSGTLTSCTGLPISTGVSGLGTGIATFLATPSSANLAAAVTDETGSGALVFATSPTLTSVTLTTPVLGTPTSGTLTNCTGLPISTGVSGLGTGIATFLATPSSANLLAAVTDETGSGLLVFATSPTLTTPAITGGTLNNSVIGGVTPAAVTGTTIQATSTLITDMFFYVNTTSSRSFPSGTTPFCLVEGLANNSSSFAITRNSADASGSLFWLSKSRGTVVNSYTIVSSGDTLGGVRFTGADGTTMIGAATIECAVDGTPAASDMPGRLVFRTTPSGSSTTSERMRIDNLGNVIINTAAIATSATDGFLYIPSCAGVPSGVPTTYTGRIPIVYDSTNSAISFYNGLWRQLGEVISATVVSGSAVSLTTATAANVTSISLTAGDWDVVGQVAFTLGGTTVATQFIAAINTTSATVPAASTIAGSVNKLQATTTTGAEQIMNAGTSRISLGATTTVYLVAQSTFTVSTAAAYGAIYARRMR